MIMVEYKAKVQNSQNITKIATTTTKLIIQCQVFPKFLHHKHITLDNYIEILSKRDQTRYMEPCHQAIMVEEEEEVVVVMVVMMMEEKEEEEEEEEEQT